MNVILKSKIPMNENPQGRILTILQWEHFFSTCWLISKASLLGVYIVQNAMHVNACTVWILFIVLFNSRGNWGIDNLHNLTIVKTTKNKNTTKSDKWQDLKIGRASLVAQWWRIHLLTQETQVWSLGQEDPIEKEMTIHSCILGWRITWTEEPGRLQSMGSQKSQKQLSN